MDAQNQEPRNAEIADGFCIQIMYKNNVDGIVRKLFLLGTPKMICKSN